MTGVFGWPDKLLGEVSALRAAANAAAGAQAAPRPGAAEVLASIEPHLSSFGITRVADLTGLDVIGVPVFCATRPNSRSLSVCLGKDIRPENARLGAIMEAVEQSLAERHEDLVVEMAAQAAMERRGLRCVDAFEILRTTASARDPRRERCWVRGLSMVDGLPVHVPFELVGFDLRSEARWDHAAYTMSTVGLGAGESMAEATLHAMLEVVENDATAMVDVFGQLSGFARPLVCRSGRHELLDDLVARVQAAGFECFFADVSGHVRLPTVAAFIATPGGSHAGVGARGFAGFACRLSPEAAAFAALLEAVQSRLTLIAGARDDLSFEDYRHGCLIKRPRGHARAIEDMPRYDLPADATSIEKLDVVLSANLRAGAHDLIVVPLGGLSDCVRVVRVLVPGLQAAAGHGVVRMGIDALEALWSPQEAAP
ncbi:YcaO-like family protein [Mesorhizobium sp. CA5]|uniref:YcaO-like family protein n=1 Tax=Mesorhizobium sp. CA5 TaxID=2876638 RepID=UPI001CD06A05|nr:YcaO-like family protein [Mesorhizobium sp. CA5]MBZ9843350.1 YcaO-like family protein [Mesorhizobium sp. CA5]